jgi:hypothetical protein
MSEEDEEMKKEAEAWMKPRVELGSLELEKTVLKNQGLDH